MVARWTAPARAACAAALLGAARGGEPRLGFVQLLDPDAEALPAAVGAAGALGVVPAGAGRGG